jgi:hypothetical protein
MSRTFALFLVLLLHVLTANAEDRPCVKQAKPLMTLKSSWDAISGAAVALPAECFDGYFGEGISDTIVRKSTKDWPGFVKELAKHRAPNDKFFLLVLKLINSTLNPDDIKTLGKLTQGSCPHDLAAQCAALSDQARKALADDDASATGGKP